MSKGSVLIIAKLEVCYFLKVYHNTTIKFNIPSSGFYFLSVFVTTSIKCLYEHALTSFMLRSCDQKHTDLPQRQYNTQIINSYKKHYSKTWLIWHLCNPFPCFIQSWLSFSFYNFSMLYTVKSLVPCTF